MSRRRGTSLSEPREFLALAHDLALALGEAETLDDALRLVLERVCRSTGWELGQAWVPQQNASRLACSSAWFASIEGLEPFRKVSELLVLPIGVGLPGRVLESKRPLWLEDVKVDPNFPRSPVAREVGLVAGMAVPVVAEGEVAAVLEFFVRERQEEDGHVLDLVAVLAAELGILVTRKRAEEALRASEARFRTLTETANDAIVSASALGVITYANAATERIFGYRQEELVGLPLQILMPERFREAHRIGLSRYLQTGQTRVIGRPAVELAGLRKDGTEFPLELSLGAWTDEEGVHFTGVLRDVTDRRQAQDALRKSETRLAEAQRLARLGSWEWDIRADAVTWSDELYRIYGLDPQEFDATYEAFLARVHPDDRERVETIIRTAFEARSRFEFDHRIVRSDGAVRTIHARGEVAVDDGGEPVRMTGTGQDVTEQRLAERAMDARVAASLPATPMPG